MSRPNKTPQLVYDFLVGHASQTRLHASDVVHFTHDEIAEQIGRTDRSVARAINQLAVEGKILERKHRMIRIKLPNNLNGKREKLRGADLSGKNFKGADFQGVDLSGTNLRGANLSGANLRGARLYDTILQDADLTSSNLRKVIGFRTNMSGARLHNVDAQGAQFFHTNMTGASIKSLKVGTPIQSDSDWYYTDVDPTQVKEFIGVGHIKNLVALIMETTLDHPNTPYMAGYVDSPRSGCWNQGLPMVALGHTEFFQFWIPAWRQLDFDPMTRNWIELEMLQLWFGLCEIPRVELYESLLAYPLPRPWLLYAKWKSKVQQGHRVGLGTFASPSEVEELGGTSDRYLEPPSAAFDGAARPHLPDFLTKSDAVRLRKIMNGLKYCLRTNSHSKYARPSRERSIPTLLEDRTK